MLGKADTPCHNDPDHLEQGAGFANWTVELAEESIPDPYLLPHTMSDDAFFLIWQGIDTLANAWLSFGIFGRPSPTRFHRINRTVSLIINRHCLQI